MSQPWSADEIIGLFNAVHMIVKGALVSAMSLPSSPFLWFSCILIAIAYDGSSDNNATYTSYMINNLKKCSYRPRLERQKMLSMNKQRKKENGETMSVVRHK